MHVFLSLTAADVHELVCEFSGGEAISREFFNSRIAGRHNPDIAKELFPQSSEEDLTAFSNRKEALFRKLAQTGASLPN